MLTYSADLNELGNPRIYGEEITPRLAKFIVESGTTGVLIYIPSATELTVDKTNTETANSTIIGDMLAIGLTLEFEQTEQRIKISGTIPNDYAGTLTDVINSAYNIATTFILKNAVNATLDTHIINLVKNRSFFEITQDPCGYCVTYSYRDGNYDLQNPLDLLGIAKRGVVEYQEKKDGIWQTIGISPVVTSAIVGGGNSVLTAQYKKCYCGPAENIEPRAIRTVREIPNCGGTSPIIYQSISQSFYAGYVLQTGNDGDKVTKASLVPYNPIVIYDGAFDCCISKDKTITVLPTNFTENIGYPHNTGDAITLKYDLFQIRNSVPANILLDVADTQLKETKTGTITYTLDSAVVTGTGTAFATDLVVGSTLFTLGGLKIGVVKEITTYTQLTMEAVYTSATATTAYKANKFYYPTPTTSTGITYTDLELGTYTLVAKYNNHCETVTKEWTINVCNSYLVVTGDCNNPKIQNISATNFLRVNITTYNSMDVVDSVSQAVILKDFLVSPASSYESPKLNDGFYKLSVQQVSSTGVNIGVADETIVFYDCDIKSCEVSLRTDLLGYDFCADCIDKKANLLAYQELERRNFLFQIQKETVYSYWDDIKYQQSIPDTWNIEDHSQELQTYTQTLNKLKTICADCGFTYSTNAVPLYSTGDCGCSK